MTTERTDLELAEGWRDAAMANRAPVNEMERANYHMLAAIHDLLAERLPTKGEPCPCGCRRNVAAPLTPADFGWTVLEQGQVAVDREDLTEVVERGTYLSVKPTERLRAALRRAQS